MFYNYLIFNNSQVNSYHEYTIYLKILDFYKENKNSPEGTELHIRCTTLLPPFFDRWLQQ